MAADVPAAGSVHAVLDGGASGSCDDAEAVTSLAAFLDKELTVHNTKSDDGPSFESLAAFWKSEEPSLASWYSRGDQYWSREDVPPTVDGMLGGLAQVAPADEKESLQLLKRLKSSRPEMSWKRAADLGGGIGRVTKNVLAKHFSSVDLIEQNSSLTDMAQTEFLADCPQLGSVAAVGLQSWLPKKSTYDCVWMQWVAGYVLDPHFVALLRRISVCLAPGGVLVVKENVTHPATCALWMDHADASTIRSRQYFQELFALGGLRVIRVTQQREWPADLYPIQVWVLEADGAQDATPP